ncbi:hypothetical protein [Oxynema sp. CENA135]|nr:hypothetical protein [Oxynema sp. CENA135]
MAAKMISIAEFLIEMANGDPVRFAGTIGGQRRKEILIHRR